MTTVAVKLVVPWWRPVSPSLTAISAADDTLPAFVTATVVPLSPRYTMLLFPHDLMLMMRANVAKLRQTVQVDPIATMFGGDDNIAIAMLRIRPEITRGVVHAPNLLAVALGAPSALPVPDDDDMTDDETIQGAEDRMREVIAESGADATKTHKLFVYGSRQMAVAGVLRVSDNDESAIDMLLEGIQGMHQDLAAGMGGSSHLTIERI